MTTASNSLTNRFERGDGMVEGNLGRCTRTSAAGGPAAVGKVGAGGPYHAGMPFYDFRCPTCEEAFEIRRPISESDQPVSCPKGHEGAVRVITTWGTGGGIRSGTPAQAKNAGTVESAAAHLAKHKRQARR